MPDLDIVGGAAVDVVPIVPNFHTKLKALVLPIADEVGKDAGERMGRAISDNIVIAIPRAVVDGGRAAQRAAAKQGDDTGGAFARSIRTKLTAAFKAMPKLDVKLGDTGVDAELARIRAKLEQLSNKRVGIDVSAEAAEAEITRLEEQLRELGAQHPNVAVRADTATARAALAEIKAEIASIPGRREVGVEVDGTFGAKLRAVVEQAQASLPDINVDADTTPARAEIQELRGQLALLAGQRVGIDIDAAEALAAISVVQERLAVLSISSADVDVKVDAAKAAAELAALQALVDDTKVFNIRAVADTSQASGALLGLAVQFAVLLAIPAFPVAVAGLGAIAAMATAAGAGVGALALAAIPAIKGVTEALKAKKAADDEAATATDNGAKKSVQAAQRALQMAGAQDTLASAHRNAARSIAQANRGVEDAERSVADAVVRAADQRRQAAESIERAEQSLADAHRNLRTAQESLTDANLDARRAEDDLTQARADAADQLSELHDRLIDGDLDQREATLRVTEAQRELQATMADPRASDFQKAEAQLAYDRAVRNAEKQKADLAALAKEAAKQRKAGVEGSAGVVSAQERVAEAQRTVRDQTQAVADAQRGVRDQVEAVADAQTASARAQVDALRTVSDAQRDLSDAVQSAADAQISAAQQVESAERGVESARLSGLDTTSKTISKQDEYRKALAQLSGPQRDLYDSIDGPTGIKGAFDRWQKSLQGLTLPVVIRMVDGAKNSLPGLTPLVDGAARGFTRLMDAASAELEEPFWQDFKEDLSVNVEPAVTGLGTAFGNTFKGMAGVVDAFFPHMDGIVARSDRITARFARWGTSLKGSPDFENFLDYVKETSPGLAEFIGEILTTALELTKALAPFSETMMDFLTPVLNSLQWLAKNGGGVVLTLWGLYAAQKAIAIGMAAFAGAMLLYEIAVAGATLVTSGWAVAINATGIVPVIRAIVLVVALLVAGLIYAYHNWDWFRNAVDGAAAGVSAAAVWLWNVILKPIFSAMWGAIQDVGAGALWLWEKAIKPAFSFIGDAAKFLFTLLVTLLLLPAYLAFQSLAWVAMWAWNNGLDDVFGWIGKAAVWVWEKGIKPAFNAGMQSFRDLGKIAKWLWNEAISPTFDWIADKAGWLYRNGVKKPFDDIRHAIGLVADSFGTAKKDIKKYWDAIQGITKGPVKFVIDKIYNGAIVPLWGKVAAITGAKKLEEFHPEGYSTGGVHGVRPGYTPGRDNAIIAVGGGEAIMRPEWTRVVGENRINAWNAAARSGGVSGVQRAISAGLPAFADGGVVDWIKDKANDVGSFVTGAADFLDPTAVFDKAVGFIKNQMKPIATNKWAKEIVKIPVTMLSGLKDKALDLVGFGGGGGGQWIKPVNVPYGTPFGKSGSMWSSGRHTGLDFPAAIGTAIKAVADGTVSMAQNGGPYGKHVMVNHGGGLASLYAHMSSMAATVGDAVQQGNQIGKVGATGNVTGPHLHLEARKNGVSVDPMTYLTGGGGNGGKGVARWRSVVQQSLKMTGNPAGYTDLTLRRMQQESGGNPTAVNNWDSNAKNGTPSVGLMQVIKPTFDAYAAQMRNVGPKLYGVSVNPLANVFSSMRYAQSRYGSLPAAYNRPGGYGAGGFPELGEMAWVGEHGKELVRFLAPAQVIPHQESMTLSRGLVANGSSLTSQHLAALSASNGGAAQTLQADVHVYVGDREITDIVRTEITLRDDIAASHLDTGRRL
ncbi:peptidoglycan DD-metalloendopeptidase family protein [Streptomyces sp. NPDC006638]|uniref:peptidoglycan DD-metalloendopeptidase family protein n=1 Tax=Streptomyces sp. NPDC006638 TaxID=3157183 RepID=UPI0033ABD773